MKKSLYYSVGLHMAVILAIALDLPFWFSSPRTVPPDNVIMVDLSQVKLAEMTNLPKKRVEKKEKILPRPEKKLPQPLLKSKEISSPLKEKKVTEEKNDVRLDDTSKTKAQKPSEKTKKESQNNAMKNLLASVEKIKKAIPKEEPPPAPVTEDDKTKGIEGGATGSYMQDLTISEKDALAAKLRSCWNLDAGVKGIEDMVVELRTFLNADGSVIKVNIMNNLRYAADPAFRSVAESARRAVFICGNMGEESPFVMLLAKRHADRYEMWREMTLFFNPLAGTVN